MRQLSHTHTREYARGPDSSHAGPMVCMWATSPTCMSSGLRAYHGGNTHVQGLRCEQHTTSNIVVPKTQTTQPTAAHFQQLSSNGSALWGITPPRTAISQVPDGGELRHPSLRHAGDAPPEGFAWRKTPTAAGLEGAELLPRPAQCRLARKNSPSTRKNAKFGVFEARRANYFVLSR